MAIEFTSPSERERVLRFGLVVFDGSKGFKNLQKPTRTIVRVIKVIHIAA